uniref:Methyltransferase type 12 n=1 Tax=uncultured organism TaxID=155900 RepID=M1Q2D8_9ZZZZ|nr:methyltransferase type 12 [uncultured organism]
MWTNAMEEAVGGASWSDSGSERGVERWEKCAEKLTAINESKKDSYAQKFLRAIKIDNDDTVLDVGCGPGTISIPISRKAKKVTSLDVSKKMLEIVKYRVEDNEINNLNLVRNDWSEIDIGKDLKKHDVVIASRSLGMCKLSEELSKLNEASKKEVYVVRTARENDIFRRNLYSALNRDYKELPTYIYVYNMLCQMELMPTVKIISCKTREEYSSFEEALELWRWRLGDLNKEEEEKISEYLHENLNKCKSGFKTPYHILRYAILNWGQKENTHTGDFEVDSKKVGNEKKYEDIDWNRQWRKFYTFKYSRDSDQDKVEKWEEVSERFNRSLNSESSLLSYVQKFLEKIELSYDSSVLDIGSGPGTISIPIAKRVRKVTALDYSENMLDLLKENARKENLENINCVNKDWRKVKIGEDIPEHDVVIASRSMGGMGLKDKLLKMKDAARNDVYLTATAKVSDFEGDVYHKVLGREEVPESEYIYYYNLLYEMGILPDLEFVWIKGGEYNWDLDRAMDHFKWKISDLSIPEEEKLRNHLKKVLMDNDKRESLWCWALISWSERE